jgi:Uma2 family endonuclease
MGIPVLSSVPEFVAWEETRGEKYEFADGEVSPDERDRPEQTVLRYPILVVEILSASTERVDPGAKLDEYRSIEALAEYALVDSRKRRAQMFRRVEKLWIASLPIFAGSFQMRSVGATIPFDEIYAERSSSAAPKPA